MFEINGCYSVYRESLSDVLALFFVVLSDLNFLSHHKSPGNPIKMTDHVLFLRNILEKTFHNVAYQQIWRVSQASINTV